jgi:tetratricopeptide (TPR) repeat protein
MNKQNIYLLTIISCLMACAEQPTRSVVLVPVEERNAPVITNKSVTTESEVVPDKGNTEVKKQKESVILALLDDADEFASKGQSEKAAATIERALRIEPRNALLWHRLAVVRLQQQQWQQAIAMARKSNALAAKNNKLKSENWAVIATAYDKLGNKQKANEARNRQTDQG